MSTSFNRRLVSSSIASLILAAAFALGGCTEEEAGEPDVRVFSENAVWTWFTDERAVFHGGHLYIGHVDTAGTVRVTTLSVNEAGHQDTTVELSSYREVDDHGNPALLPMQDGRLLAAYSPHEPGAHWYWRFENGDSGRVHWSDERRTDRFSHGFTYSNLLRLRDEGRIYNFSRGINWDPTMMRSEDGGETWSSPQHFIRSEGEGTRPYVKYVSNGRDRFDLLYTQGHPRQKKNNVYHLYYRDGALYRSDGTQLCRLAADDCLPVRVEQGTKVYDASEAGRAWVWDVEYADGGIPVAAYVVARDSTVGKDLRYRYARYDPEAKGWHEEEIAHAGTRLYEGENHYAGGMALDPSRPRRVYISSDVDPATGDSTASGHYQIYRGSVAQWGEDWRWTQLTATTSEDNLRPFVPHPGEAHRAVLWLRGRYSTYTEYDTDVVGVIE